MYQLRKIVPTPVKQLLQIMRYATMFADARSFFLYLQVIQQKTVSDSAAGFLDLRIRQLDRQSIRIRTRGRDAQVIFSTFFYRFHLPPSDIVSPDALTILDLGANIGCTIAHLAHIFPAATILGVELDRENALLARLNIQPWSNRCRIVEGAVWPFDGEVQYEHSDTNQDGYTATARQPQGATNCTKYAQAFSIETLCNTYLPGREIDFVKMDIEGAERSVLKQNTAWAHRIRCIKIELHGYEKRECIADLNNLGIKALPDARHPDAVVGARRM